MRKRFNISLNLWSARFSRKAMATAMLLCLGLFVSTSLRAQALQYNWVQTLGSVGDDECSGIALSPDGFLFTAGTYSDSIDLDPGPGVQMVACQGQENSFISRFDTAGNFIWGRVLQNSGMARISKIEAGPQNEVYVCGQYTQGMTVSDGSNTFALDSVSGGAGFILKFSQNGNLSWAKTIESQTNAIVADLGLDSQGNLYATGSFADSTNFDVGGAGYYLKAAQAFPTDHFYDVFVAKYDSAGNFVWARSFGEDSGDSGLSLSVDPWDRIVVGGSYKKNPDTDPGAGANLIPYSGADGMFVVRFDSSGNHLWGFGLPRASGGGHVFGELITDENGNIYIGGGLEANLDLDPGPGTYTVTGFAGRQGFYAKYDSAGAFQWGNSFGNASTTSVADMALDASGQLYLLGYYWGNMNVTDANSNTIFVPGIGQFDVYLARYDQNAQLLGVTHLGSNGYDLGIELEIAASGQIYAGGYFNQSVDFDPGAGVANRTANGAADDFWLLRLEGSCSDQQLQTTVSDFSLCEGDSVLVLSTGMDSIYYAPAISNGVYFSPSATQSYTAFGVDSLGCRDENTFVIEVVSIDLAVTLSGDSLQAQQSGAAYQWLDCSNGFVPIGGANQSTFVPVNSGAYAVEITLNGCVDTSACYPVIVTGLDAAASPALVNAYPNPSSGILNLSFADHSQALSIIVRNAVGQVLLVDEKPALARKHTLQLPLAAGLYFVEIRRQDQLVELLKVVRE